QEFPCLEVTLDGRRDADEAPGDLIGLEMVHRSGVERLNLLDEDLPEERAGLTSTQTQGFLWRQIAPARFGGIMEERFLDGGSFAAEAHDSRSKISLSMGTTGGRFCFRVCQRIEKLTPKYSWTTMLRMPRISFQGRSG